jgi:hypothetical protein
MLTSTDAAEPLTASHVLQAAFPALGNEMVALAAVERAVHVIPNGAEPRWVILGNPRKALPVLRSWRPWNLSSRLRWSAVLFAASIKMLHRLPGVTSRSACIDTSYWQRNLPEFSESWTAVVHLGSPSYTRKAIVFFLGKDQAVKAVAKIPLAPAAALAILNEAAILQRMKAIEYLPRVQFQDSARGVAAQSWLDGKPVSRSFTSAHVDLLSFLANPGIATRVCDYQAEIAAQLDEHDLPFDRSVLTHGVELLSFDEPLQGFVEHRDFAPWNLKRLPDGSLGLLDWEWAVPNSLPWQDACRFFYLQDVHFNGRGNVWEALTHNRLLQRYCQRFAIPIEALPPLTMHYLLRVLCMDWQSGNTGVAQYTFTQIQLLLDIHRKTAVKT